MIHHLWSNITDNPSTAMHLCGASLSPFYSDTHLMLWKHKTQPFLLLCHSCMRSCILRSCTSQAHTCPAETTSLKQQGGNMYDLWIVWILKLFDWQFLAIKYNKKQPCISCQSVANLLTSGVHTPTGGQSSNIFVLLCFLQARVRDEDLSSHGKETPPSLCILCTHQTQHAHSRLLRMSESLSRVYLQQTCSCAGSPRLREQKQEEKPQHHISDEPGHTFYC